LELVVNQPRKPLRLNTAILVIGELFNGWLAVAHADHPDSASSGYCLAYLLQ
jgi:hypothetical protein